jgi:hypothetical protein
MPDLQPVKTKVSKCPVGHGATCPRRNPVTTKSRQDPIGDLGITDLKIDVAKGYVPEQVFAIRVPIAQLASRSARHRSCQASIQASASFSVSSRLMCHCWMLDS